MSLFFNIFFLTIFAYLFIYLFKNFFWLCWVFVSVWGLSPVAASGGHSSSRCAGLSLSRPLPLWTTGSRRAGSVIVAHGPSCSAACGILPDQGSNPCPLHWQADSQPLRHQRSPHLYTFIPYFIYLFIHWWTLGLFPCLGCCIEVVDFQGHQELGGRMCGIRASLNATKLAILTEIQLIFLNKCFLDYCKPLVNFQLWKIWFWHFLPVFLLL